MNLPWFVSLLVYQQEQDYFVNLYEIMQTTHRVQTSHSGAHTVQVISN